MSTIRIWSDALFQAICIASPLILPASSYRKRAATKSWRLVLAMGIMLFILFSPFSFVGTRLDHVVCALLASTIVASSLSRKVPTERVLVPSMVIGILVILAYTPGKALFGARVLKEEIRDGLVHRIIEIPDMVLSSRYFEEVHRRWFIFEQELSRTPWRAGQELAVRER